MVNECATQVQWVQRQVHRGGKKEKIDGSTLSHLIYAASNSEVVRVVG